MRHCSRSSRPRSPAAIFLLASVLVFTLSTAHGEPRIEIKNAWARATAPGQVVAGVYLDISSSEDARIVGVRSPAAKSAEMHSMSTAGGMMKMRRLDGLDLPAARTVEFAPGGNHIMLLDIKEPLVPGGRVPLTLIVSRKGKHQRIELEAEVRALGDDGSNRDHRQ